MNLFDNYLNELDSVLSKKVKITGSSLSEQRTYTDKIQKSLESTPINLNEQNNLPAIISGPKVLFTYDKTNLDKHFGINSHAFNTITIGAHPDFFDLDLSSYVNHHCVSMFIDIKGSTRLIEKYSLLEVRLIKDSLLTLAIQVANQFGGHVHRLQGDGIFLQFVRRNKIPNDAIINSINAASVLTQFVSVDLAKVLSQYELRPLKIRIGIDYGNDEQVLWSHYGLPGCGELTTTSLHTDMAAKLQSKAPDNCILIGGNIKKKLDLKSDFYSIFETEESKEKVYYISKQFTYPFFVFNWQEYLLSFPFIGKASDGKSLEMKAKPFWIQCFVYDESSNNKTRYFPNSNSIPKGKQISYQLMRGDYEFIKQPYERIEWRAFNSGKQAADCNMSNHDFNKSQNDKTICETAAAYLGHHYVEYKIIQERSPNERVTFPIFVQ